jgi:hypothetical protein
MQEQAEALSLKKRYPFKKPREPQMEIDGKTIPSPPSATQRETNIIQVDPVAPVAPVDMFRDIAVGHKRPT